ncbi:methionyl-tRNA formyltransferase [Methanosarcina sp. 1.H.T.1A.1]|nr:methionyl-tRNA formyltransferase [Methanosarcina sp. 1.H.T.1A.1]
MNIAVLTSEQSSFVPYADTFVNELAKRGYNVKLFFEHEAIADSFEIVFILSYFRIIRKEFLNKHKHNIVVHGSDLPKGRGWTPIFWQILEGKNEIPLSLFEANEGIDDGDIYFKDKILYEGHELNSEIRQKQAEKTIDLCFKFLENYTSLNPVKQVGEPTFYKKRSPIDSELDIDKSIKEQFNLLRIVSNEEFPAFFYYKGHKYLLKIYKGIEES